MHIIEAKVNNDLKNIVEWSESNYLSINPSKTKAMYFSHGSVLPNVSLMNENIGFVSHHKILGIYIDTKLDFTFHVNSVISRISFILRRLYCHSIHLPVNIKKRVALSLCLPLLLNGLEVFSGSSQQNLTKLRLSFNRVVKYIFNIKYRHHISGFVYNVLGSDFQTFINIRLLIQFYKIIFHRKPNYLLEKFNFGRSSRTNTLICPIHSSLFMTRSFVVRVSRLWNNYIPYEERNVYKSIEQFSKLAKNCF